jgi:trehalose 6-phosphate synthase/phosphatase
VNKGEIVRRLIYENPDADFIFCAGDDKVSWLSPKLCGNSSHLIQTDEDMFRSLRSIFPPGGPVADEPLILKPPVAITSSMEPEEAAEMPDVELKIKPQMIFSTTVGPPAKKTLAGWHVTCPEEVVDAMESLLDFN